MAKLCIFTGHRILPHDLAPLRQALMHTMCALSDDGYTDFACGGAMGFDLLAAEQTLKLRALRPEIRLLLILPCPEQDRRWPNAERRRYAEIVARADVVRYTADHYYNGCMLTRDRTLAAAADYCLCFMTRGKSGTGYTVRQALMRDVPVINLAETMIPDPTL